MDELVGGDDDADVGGAGSHGAEEDQVARGRAVGAIRLALTSYCSDDRPRQRRGPAGRTRRPRSRCSRIRRDRCRRSGTERLAATARSRRRVAAGRRPAGSASSGRGSAGRARGSAARAWKRRRHGAGRRAARRPARVSSRAGPRGASASLSAARRGRTRYAARCAPLRVRRRVVCSSELAHLQIVLGVEDRLRRRLDAARPSDGRLDRHLDRLHVALRKRRKIPERRRRPRRRTARSASSKSCLRNS